jgi:O-antigen/teichoic acid export membrane protein
MMLARMRAVIAEQVGGQRWELLSSTAIALAVRIFGAGTQFAFTLMLGRLLGAQGTGLYALALSVCTFGSILGRVGMDVSILRFVAVHRTREHWPRLSHGWRTMVGYACVSSCVVAGVLFVFAPYVAEQLFAEPGLAGPLRWMLLSIVPFGLLNLLAESLRAVQRIGDASLVQAGLVPAFSTLFFGLLYYFGFGVDGAVLAYVGATVLVCILAYRLWLQAMPGLAQAPARDGPTSGEILSVSMPMAWISISLAIRSLIDTVILGYFRPAAEVGVYSAAMRVSLLINFMPVAVASFSAPKFATLYQQGAFVAMEKLAQSGTKLVLLLTLPVLLIFLLAPAMVLQVFGEPFRSGATVLVILSVGQLVNIAVGFTGLLLLMTRHERQMQWISTVAVLGDLSLCFLLIPTYGMIGAAIASASGLVLLNLLALFATVRWLKVSTTPWVSIARRAVS